MSPELRAKQREFLKRPARFSTKAWYAAFLLSKDPSSPRKLSRPARLCLTDIACSRPFAWALASFGRAVSQAHIGQRLLTM